MHNNRKQVVSHLKPLCNNKNLWDSFCDYLDILIAEQHKKLEQAEDIASLHRAQGAVQVLNRVKLLRDEALADG